MHACYAMELLQGPVELLCCRFTNSFAKTWLPQNPLLVDVAYQDVCNIIKKQSKRLSQEVFKIIIFCFGIQSVNPCIKPTRSP